VAVALNVGVFLVLCGCVETIFWLVRRNERGTFVAARRKAIVAVLIAQLAFTFFWSFAIGRYL
jgi:hypothetical protein